MLNSLGSMRAFRLASLCVCVSVESVCGGRGGGVRGREWEGGVGGRRWGGGRRRRGWKGFSIGNVVSHDKDKSSVLSEEASYDELASLTYNIACWSSRFLKMVDLCVRVCVCVCVCVRVCVCVCVCVCV